MERQFKVSAFAKWDLGYFDQSGNLAFFADMRQVHGEAVAEVDHGSSPFSEPGSNFEPWHGVKMGTRSCWLDWLSSIKLLQDGS